MKTIAKIKSILAFIGLKLIYKRELAYNVNQPKILASFYSEVSEEDKKFLVGTSCIIFSMDRAIQLHALLGSIFEKVNPEVPIFILYRSTSLEHEKAYEQLKKIYSNKQVNFVKQIEKSTFAAQLTDIIENIETNKLFFLVDDILVIENIDTDDFNTIDPLKYILSLRLGKNLTFAYTINKSQPLPQFLQLPSQNDKICWRWSSGLYDWAYPLSVDGHLFSTKEILAMTKSITFNSPNTYEGNLQIFNPIFMQRYGLAYTKSRLFNVPCNKVQSEIHNRHGQIHQDELLRKWNDGYQINYKTLFGFNNIGVHQEVNLNFIIRNE